jgi:hypothetical protein
LWPNLAGILLDEFNAPLPLPVESSIVGVFDGQKLAAFAEVSTPVHLGATFVFPEYRGTGVHLDLIRHIEQAVDASGRSAYVVVSNERVGAMCKRRGLVPLDRTLYWREANGRR